MTTTVQLNGRPVTVQAEPDTPLLWLLRGELRLTGTKYGCGIAQCGACTVHVDGEPVRACVTPLAVLGGRALTTIEGLGGREADAVRDAWVALDVVQCGYCQSGQVMAATALLRRVPQPDDAQIDAALAGNLCRCGTYPRIRAAVHAAARSLAGGAASTSASASASASASTLPAASAAPPSPTGAAVSAAPPPSTAPAVPAASATAVPAPATPTASATASPAGAPAASAPAPVPAPAPATSRR